MTYKSAYEKNMGINPATKGVLNKLKNLYRGYYEIELNLNDFISHNRLDMILNNDIIRCDSLYFELYNYVELFNAGLEEAWEDLKEELKNFDGDPESDGLYLLNDLSDYYGLNLDDIDGTINEALEDYVADHIYLNNEVYQYFIIPYNDVDLWEEYTNYPIFYNDEMDLYLLGITHWGMSWDYFETSFKVREYI